MGPATPGTHTRRRRGGGLWAMLTFDRMITGPVIHLVYWAGLGVIVIAAFSVIGAAAGVALREGSWAALLLAIPVLVGGLLAVAAMALIWRAFCEFYVAIFRIGDDLAALRRSAEEDAETRRRVSA
ncbi:MAG: DUF4282 domain-containing protein [Caulobacteraceae bacterium]